MRSGPDCNPSASAASRRVRRPEHGHPPDRPILLGVSHPSDDPARHRVFAVRAGFDTNAEGWVAQVAEQDPNEQRGDWGETAHHGDRPTGFPTAATGLGDAVTMLVTAVDREAEDRLRASETYPEQHWAQDPQRSWTAESEP